MYFDIIIALMIVVLALKGLFTGLVREVCSVAGIVGGVLLASRFSQVLGDSINSLLKLESQTLINLIGFVVILGSVWVLSLVLAEIILRFVKFIKLGVFDKILGVLVAGGKIFLILSIIFFTFSKINFLSNWTLKLRDTSEIYPVMIKVGDFIIKTDFASQMQKNISTQINNGLDAISEKSAEKSAE